MKNDLTCGIVQDLLPSYIERLTGEETNEAVRRHLAACPDCAARAAAMSAPESGNAQQGREVDYLKAVRRKTCRRVAAAVLCTLAVFLAGLAVKLFIIGEPAGREGMSWSVQYENDALDLRAYSTWSSIAYCRWQVQRDGAVLRLSARQVLPSFLYRSADHREHLTLDGIEEVYLAGHLIWQKDTVISSHALTLYEKRTPYTGDASALGAIAAALDISGQCGSCTMQLQTSAPPYGWTLNFSDSPDAQKAAQIDQTMAHRFAPLMLALVDNLGEVSWTYPLNGQTVTHTVTLAQADEALSRSVKDSAATAADFQQLYTLVMN